MTHSKYRRGRQLPDAIVRFDAFFSRATESSLFLAALVRRAGATARNDRFGRVDLPLLGR